MDMKPFIDQHFPNQEKKISDRKTMSSYKVRITVEKLEQTDAHTFCGINCREKDRKGWELMASSGATVGSDSLVNAFPLINEEITKQWPRVQELAGFAEQDPKW